MEADRPLGDCADCGKKCFASRGAAERHARRLYPGRRMRIYACGQWWHLTSQDAATTETHRERLARGNADG